MAQLALLLDEHYPATLASSLSGDGLDADAVIDRDDLRGCDDLTVLTTATREHRVVVTEDVRTFPAAIARIPQHAGVVFCDSQRFPRTADALPHLENALAAFVANPPDVASFPGFVWWLTDPATAQ